MVVTVLHITKRKNLILIRLNGISFFSKDRLFHFKDYILNQLTSCIPGSICFSIVLLFSLSTKLFFTSSLFFCQRVPVVANRVAGFLLACQRGRVGKAAQLTPPSAAAPFRPLTPVVVRSGGRNTAQDESCKRAPTAGAACPCGSCPTRPPGDEPAARNGASTD